MQDDTFKQVWYRLTQTSTRLNEGFGNILTPMCFGWLGGGGSNKKNLTQIYKFCSLLFFFNTRGLLKKVVSRSQVLLGFFLFNFSLG